MKQVLTIQEAILLLLHDGDDIISRNPLIKNSDVLFDFSVF